MSGSKSCYTTYFEGGTSLAMPGRLAIILDQSPSFEQGREPIVEGEICF